MFTVDTMPPTVTLADLSGDGKADVCAIINTSRSNIRSQRLVVLTGNGDGTFRKYDGPGPRRDSVDLTPDEFAALCTGDLDGDGVAEAVITSREASSGVATGRMLHLEKDGALADAGAFAFQLPTKEDVTVVDAVIDAQGTLALLIQAQAPLGTHHTFVMLHNPKPAGTPDDWKVFSLDDAGTDGFNAIAAGDLDGDGRAEFVVTEPAPRPKSPRSTSLPLLYVINPLFDGGGFQTNPLFEKSGVRTAQNIGLADMNGDGRADLVASAGTDLVYSSFDPKSLIWSPRSNISLYGNTSTVAVAGRVAVGDVNGDGFNDILVLDPLRDLLTYYEASGKPGDVTFAIQDESKGFSSLIR
jgi:hypothetical protein